MTCVFQAFHEYQQWWFVQGYWTFNYVWMDCWLPIVSLHVADLSLVCLQLFSHSLSWYGNWVLFCRTSLSFSLRAIITLNFLFKKLVQETFQETILVQVLHRCIHVGLASQMPNSKIVAPKICNCAFMKKLLHAVNL